MHSAAYMKRLTTAVAGAALASALAVSGASAHYGSWDAGAAGDPPEVAPRPPRSRSLPLRSTRTCARPNATAEGYADGGGAVAEPAGFDLVSAAIGAAAAGGLSLVLMATLGMRRPAARRPASLNGQGARLRRENRSDRDDSD